MPLPTATFTIDRPGPGTAVVAIVGDLDVYSAPDLRSTHIDLINEGRYRQVIDLTAVTYADSSGLGVIVGALKRARSRGGNLAIVTDMTGGVGAVLYVTGVQKAIPHAATVDEALKMLAPKPGPVRSVAPSPREIAAGMLRDMIRTAAREVPGFRIEETLDLLADQGRIRGLDYGALAELRDAVAAELLAAAEQDRIAVTIADAAA